MLSINTNDFVEDLHNFNDFFDLTNLKKSHELFSIKNKKLFGNFRTKALEKVWIDEVI